MTDKRLEKHWKFKNDINLVLVYTAIDGYILY